MTRKEFLDSLLGLSSLSFLGCLGVTGLDLEEDRQPPEQYKPKSEWRELLPEDVYAVLFEEWTEPRWSSPLNQEGREGTYICAACFNPLFLSETKYDSGTGWPSFWETITGRIGTRQDRSFGIVLYWEYHCRRCGGHQGHVFDDGPPPTGMRFCNNGLALQFVPKNDPLPQLRT